MQRTLQVMHAPDTEYVELSLYRLRDIGRTYYVTLNNLWDLLLYHFDRGIFLRHFCRSISLLISTELNKIDSYAWNKVHESSEVQNAT